MNNDSVLSMKGNMGNPYKQSKTFAKNNKEPKQDSAASRGSPEYTTTELTTQSNGLPQLKKGMSKGGNAASASQIDRPMWRKEKVLDKVGSEMLLLFEDQLQGLNTTYHRHANDSRNIIGDKTVQMHKQSKRRYEWYRDLSNNPDNAHEKRFEQLPYSGLPTVNSKHMRFNNSVDMKKEKGRDAKIVEMV